MKTIEIIQRIEGEAKLKLFWKNDIVDYAQIEFLNFRGFEQMLQNKPILDALVMTPRVCGICGQAHLVATARAIENIYHNYGYTLEISQKAELIRQIALNFEIISSHIKWFYLFILPDILELQTEHNKELLANDFARYAIKYSSEILKGIAIFAGQWPHSSFVLPGGVVSDPTTYDIALASNYLDVVINFMQKSLFGKKLENIDCFDFGSGDFGLFLKIAFEEGLQNIGHSYDRFLSLGLEEYDNSKITSEHLLYGYSKANTINYDSNFVETGPLARMLKKEDANILSLYEKYQDSALTRICGRILELVPLVLDTQKMLNQININQPSFIKPKVELNSISRGFGYSAVEAARGSLYHEVSIERGIISKYKMITPTAWNLGPGNKKNLGTAQKALIGLNSQKLATIVLRSFDVCAVCTTH